MHLPALGLAQRGGAPKGRKSSVSQVGRAIALSAGLGLAFQLIMIGQGCDDSVKRARPGVMAA